MHGAARGVSIAEFAHISMNWRGRPRESRVELIGATTTRTGLRAQSELDTGTHPTQVRITQGLPVLKAIRDALTGDPFLPKTEH